MFNFVFLKREALGPFIITNFYFIKRF